MAQILSQEEVDALLTGLTGGAIEAETDQPRSAEAVIPYDFTNQDRIVRGRMPTLEMIHDRFTRLFRTTISGSLRRAADVSIVNSEIVKFGDFIRGLPVPTSLHVFRMEPLKGFGVLVVEGKLVFALVECFFGGRGGSLFKLEGREFTPIEQKVIKRVVDLILEDYRVCWKPVHPVSVEFVRSEINPQFVNVVPPSDVVTTIECELELEEAAGRFIFCLPYSTLEPIRDQLRAGFQSENFEVDNAWMDRLRMRLREAPVDVRVQLGTASLRGRDLLRLQAGDVIPLNEDRSTPLKVFVEDMLKFRGKPGSHNGNRAVQICGIQYPKRQ
ncbi:MAG: flagellar motor switch protein FliM [Candidatus Sumerlaeota bacterium]|nr:flagellar motor switch protein FliM [Candidatus Sumerlaeota bacterium]